MVFRRFDWSDICVPVHKVVSPSHTLNPSTILNQPHTARKIRSRALSITLSHTAYTPQGTGQEAGSQQLTRERARTSERSRQQETGRRLLL